MTDRDRERETVRETDGVTDRQGQRETERVTEGVTGRQNRDRERLSERRSE